MKRQPQSKPRSGDRLKVIADCGVRNDDDSNVRSTELRGEVVTAAGVNCNYDHADTGEPMVAATLGNGALTAIPRRALKAQRASTRTGYSRRFANAWNAIFA